MIVCAGVPVQAALLKSWKLSVAPDPVTEIFREFVATPSLSPFRVKQPTDSDVEVLVETRYARSVIDAPLPHATCGVATVPL